MNAVTTNFPESLSERFQAALLLRSSGTRWMARSLRILSRIGKLSMKQVFDVLSVQADTWQMFGEIAVEKGYLSEMDLAVLLLAQRSGSTSLSEILVEMEALSELDCREAFLSFQQDISRNYAPHGTLADAPAQDDRQSDEQAALAAS